MIVEVVHTFTFFKKDLNTQVMNFSDYPPEILPSPSAAVLVGVIAPNFTLVTNMVQPGPLVPSAPGPPLLLRTSPPSTHGRDGVSF